MVSKIKLSVIIPIYNSEKYLGNCIKSVLKQQMENFELILIDDGSTDGSWKICEYFQKEDYRVKAIRKENGGPSSARERGYLESNGEWITFIDNDDIIHPNMFSILFKNNIDSSIDIIGGGRIDLDSGEIESYEWNSEDNKFKLFDGKYVCDNMIELSKGYLTIPLWGKVYRKSLLDQFDFNKYKFLCPTIYFEDVLLTPFLLFNAKKIKLIENTLYIHREVKTSISRSGKFSRFYSEQVETGNIVLDFCKQNKLNNIYKWQLNNYYRVILRSWILLKKLEASESEKNKIRKQIKSYYLKYYKDFMNNAACSIPKKMIVSMFKISPNFWGMCAGLAYNHFNIRY